MTPLQTKDFMYFKSLLDRNWNCAENQVVCELSGACSAFELAELTAGDGLSRHEENRAANGLVMKKCVRRKALNARNIENTRFVLLVSAFFTFTEGGRNMGTN